MIPRWLRLFIALAVTALASGFPQVVMAAMDCACCAEPCDGSDGKQCPPNCPSGVCARVHASLGAVVAPSVVMEPARAQAVVVHQATPELPLVVSGFFHPPIA